MNRLHKMLWIAMLLMLLPLRQFAQQPYRPYSDEGITLNFFEIDNIDFRLFLLYDIEQNDRFSLIAEEENGRFAVVPGNDNANGNFIEDFDAFYNNTLADFSFLTKPEIDELRPVWKASVSPVAFTLITLDVAMRRSTTENNHCIDSNPFCTSDVITFDAATTSQTAEQLEAPGVFDDGCIGSSYNPSWYHMRINTPGQFIIHMEGHDPNNYTNRDIDFCCWGPFDDPVAPCVAQLTSDKIIDCNYSTSYSEDLFMGYPPNEHYHQSDHQTVNYHMPETGEYYILMICNFSQQPCTISFTKTEGSGPGTTDCGILPGIAANDGPYCVGQTISLTVTTQAGATYSWTGPNGYTSTVQNPILTNCTLEMAGTYTCVTTVDNETTTGTTEVEIFPMPIANFSATSVCEGETTQFTSTATTDPSGQSIESYTWDFGDGETATGATASHTYATAGTYQVTHTTTNGEGLCFDEVTQTVVVNAMPVPTASANPGNVDYNGVSTLTADAGVEGSFTYHWEPANMVVDPNSQTTQTVGIIETQVYTVTVTNTEGGCTSTAQVTVVMGGSNMTATASADQYEICDGSTTTLHAHPINGTGSYTYNWSPANLLSNATSQNPVATPPVGTTNFSCIVGDGIIDQEISVSITVYPNEATDIVQTICEGTSYNFFGNLISAAGVYTHHLQTSHGCDSLITLHLGINDHDESNIYVGDNELQCDEYFWDPQGHQIISTDHEGMIYNHSGVYHRTYKNLSDCDSIVELNLSLQYTPDPTPIYPKDPTNHAPHWVVTATEFQINSYEFYFWDNNGSCHWDSVSWRFDNPNVGWLLEPDLTTTPIGLSCTMHVLEHVDDTIWLSAKVYNSCAPQGIERRYWFVCSFYDVDENQLRTNFDVVPNPNNGQMQLNFENLTGRIDVKVYDMSGTLIDNFVTFNERNSMSYSYSMKQHANGIYYFVATSKEGTVAKKVVIQE